MKNVMMIDGQWTVIEYDPDIEMFRGEFVGLNGSADCYGENIAGLKHEGKLRSRFFWICVQKKESSRLNGIPANLCAP